MFETDLNSFYQPIEIIKQACNNIKLNYLLIGQTLSDLVDNDSFFISNWLDVYDFAEQVFGFSRTSVKNMINVYKRFSDHASPVELLPEYSDFNYSQLVECLPLDSQEINTYINPDMSVRQIKDYKASKKIAAHNNTIKSYEGTLFFNGDMWLFNNGSYNTSLISFLNSTQISSFNIVLKEDV